MQEAPPSPTATPSGDVPDDAGEAANLVLDTIGDLVEGFLANLPLIGIALALFVIGLFVARWVGRGAHRGLTRTGVDANALPVIERLIRLVVIVAVLLLALSVAGVDVGAALATLGIVGLALAFALQNILENFVSGILLLVRKPFRVGDQIRTGDFEGTVDDIDLRVTRIIDYDGETVLVPNSDVFTNPLVNLTRRGRRRSRVMIGVDYRDDHDAARAVIHDAVAAVDGVLSSPDVEVYLTELGDSSVNFEVRYWTAPDIASVRRVQDRVLSAAKTAIEGAGMTIPWPIRTLVMDGPVRVDRNGQARGGA